MRFSFMLLSMASLALVFCASPAHAQRGGRGGSSRGGSPQHGGSMGGGSQQRGGSMGGGGPQRGGGTGGSERGGGFGGGLSSSGSSNGMKPSGGMGPHWQGSGSNPGRRTGGSQARPGMGNNSPRPGAENGERPSGSAGNRPGAQGATAQSRPSSNASGAQGAAAGAAAANRNSANATGAQGAAAGAAAANRNAPNATGAHGAAAGAAAANRNAPSATGAQGAAAGAAVANRNSTNATGAQGAAMGAAAANRNAPYATGAQGAAAGAAFANRNSYDAAAVNGTRYTSAAALQMQNTAIRAAAVTFPVYSPAIYANCPSAWQPTNIVTSSLYQHPGYSALAVGLGLNSKPVPYDYGANVVIQQGSVYVNGDATGDPQQYAEQADQIASVGQSTPPAEGSKWLPLGVFALVEGSETNSDDVFQIAVNPQGIIRGNYSNKRTNETESISGSVDKATQRAAWTIGSDQFPVYESGISNLLKDATTILVHTGEGQARQLSLIRLEEPTQ